VTDLNLPYKTETYGLVWLLMLEVTYAGQPTILKYETDLNMMAQIIKGINEYSFQASKTKK